MAKNKKHRRENSPTVTEKIPLVSVIIPMYNAAKFIPQTLESLLYQTMTDFEVVVVDDCSTDDSVAVVENFSERFGGRLKVVKLKQNTGTPGLPRNVGINFARGKYIAFLDSDDLYTKTALEEWTTLAEKFQVDVVHMNDTYRLFGGGQGISEDDPRMNDFAELINPKNFSYSEWRYPFHKRPKPVAAPTMLPNDLEKRVNFWVTWNCRWVPYGSLCRRDFLIANQIQFPNMRAYEDAVFTFKYLCLAEKILHVPNVVYIIRSRNGSIMRDIKNSVTKDYLSKWFSVLNDGFKLFDDFMTQIPFFKQNPSYRFAVLNFFFRVVTDRHVCNIYLRNPPQAIYPALKENFQADDAALAAYLFNTANVYRLQIMKLQQELAALKNGK